MQTWAKRGLQTALVTGGLLMLGTGIASANENVNPDRPASPIDGGVAVPMHITNNAVGTPVGQVRPPTVDRTVSTDDVTDAATGGTPRQISTPAAGVASQPLAGAATESAPLSGDLVRSNRGRVDVVVPVDISGNAIAAGGDAAVANESHQAAARHDPVLAGWNPGPLTGNAVVVDHAAPVQVTGNAISLVGTAASVNDASQSATTGGDVTTSGANRTLAGNVIAEQGATPVQVDGNAVAGGGQAYTESDTSSDANSHGSLGTSGANGTGSGNVGAVPLAVPVELTDQAVSGIGNANSAGHNSATAEGGSATRPSFRGPSYVVTNGDPSTASGNAVVPGVANPAMVACNAVGAIGNSDAECGSTNDNTAGGAVTTTGVGSTGSGNLAVAPVAEPVEAFGNAASGIGNANSGASNSDHSRALGNSYTLGDGSALSANDITAPVAGANDVFADGASGLGNAAATADNDVDSTAGGYSGTTGTGSTGSGNIGQLPVAAPVEAYGLAGAAGGNAHGTVPVETKTVRAGGNPNADDDRGTASSNVVSAPTAVPAQVFGDAAGVAANTGSEADNTSTVVAGGDPTATGVAGTGSGNIVQLATATPAQVFNDGASVVGNGAATGSNDTTVGSGGKATADGHNGTLAGDVVNVPDAGPVQAFGVAGALPGTEEAESLSNTYTTAGDDTTTNGNHGALAGDVVTAQVSQVEQVLGTGLAGAGNSRASGVNNTATNSGGNVTTSGEWGALSGDLANVPATDITQATADGVAVLGYQRSFGGNTVDAVSGGSSTTSGSGFLNGVGLVAPLGASANVYRVPVEVLGRVVDSGWTTTSVTDGDTDPAVDLPVGMGGGNQPQFGPTDAADNLLQADQVPAIGDLLAVPSLRRTVPGRPMSAMDLQHTQIFPTITDLPGEPSVAVPSVSVPSAGQPTTLLPRVPALPGAAPRTQSMPAGPVTMPGLPALPGVSAFRGVPPESALERTAVIPVIRNGPMVPAPAARPAPASTQAAQVRPTPRYVPMAGELPVGGQLPGGQRPGGQRPGGQLPGGQLPGGAPQLAAPQFPQVPAAQLPATQLPTPHMPSANLPTVNNAASVPSLQSAPAPSLPAPAVSRPSLPNVQAPHLAAPNLAAPNLAAPNLAAPTLGSPSLSSMPDLPPVPTLPAMPPLPGRPGAAAPYQPAAQHQPRYRSNTQDLPAAPGGLPSPSLSAPSLAAPSVPKLTAPRVSGPSVPTVPSASQDVPAAPSLFTPNVPSTQDVPAGSAQQLMAQLRGLISELENDNADGTLTGRGPGDIQPPTI